MENNVPSILLDGNWTYFYVGGGSIIQMGLDPWIEGA